MTLGEAIAGILQREGITVFAGTPVSAQSVLAIAIRIRPITVRQAWMRLNRAEASARVISRRRVAPFLTAKQTTVSWIPIAA